MALTGDETHLIEGGLFKPVLPPEQQTRGGALSRGWGHQRLVGGGTQEAILLSTGAADLLGSLLWALLTCAQVEDQGEDGAHAHADQNQVLMDNAIETVYLVMKVMNSGGPL